MFAISDATEKKKAEKTPINKEWATSHPTLAASSGLTPKASRSLSLTFIQLPSSPSPSSSAVVEAHEDGAIWLRNPRGDGKSTWIPKGRVKVLTVEEIVDGELEC